MDLFEAALAVPEEEIEFTLRGIKEVPWADFYLNPRRLRGSDFLMRWSQGLWSEERIIEAVNDTGQFLAMPYGPSSVAPSQDVREFELYFEHLEKAGLDENKRPDLLIFPISAQERARELVDAIGGEEELPFTSDASPEMCQLLDLAILAVECENSLWKATQMPNYGEDLRPMRRLDNKPGLPKAAKLPTIILKEEDRGRLQDWQAETGIDIHIWHVFYDLAYGISLDRIDELVAEGLIEPTEYTYQGAGGSASAKVIYKVYYHYAYETGKAVEEPNLVADHIIDKNGHILPYVRFQGGDLRLMDEAIEVLEQAEQDED